MTNCSKLLSRSTCVKERKEVVILAIKPLNQFGWANTIFQGKWNVEGAPFQ